jgi:putative nucleotidyltransferase with HDIG domain
MIANLLHDARNYLVTFLKGKRNIHEIRHPWRQEWQHMALHSLRVESYVLKILAREPHPLTKPDVRLLRLAAILHDIGRLEKTKNHAKTGANIVRSWLQGYPGEDLQENDIEVVVDMIADHSNKETSETDFRRAVLKDADILDEIGAMSIFMASSWLSVQSPFFFYELQKRLIEVEVPFCDRQLTHLNTGAAKEILKEKKAFIEHFIAQLGDELQTDPDMDSSWFPSQEFESYPS